MDQPARMPTPQTAAARDPALRAAGAETATSSDQAPAAIAPAAATARAAARTAAPPLAARPGAGPESVIAGGQDSMGNTVGRVFSRTAMFAIYTLAGKDDSTSSLGLRYQLPEDYETSRAMRRNLIPIAGLVASISDMVAGMRPYLGIWPFRSRTYDSLCARTVEVLARAMIFAFEGEGQTARDLLLRVREEIETRRDSMNRMRYVFANVFACAIILTVGYAAVREGDWLPVLRQAAPLGAGAGEALVIDALLLGALGAFFSVSLDVGSVKVRHALTFSEMLYAGFVRIPIGVIAAGVVTLLISSGWMLTAIDPASRAASLHLFGFLAGFSEFFVPNALKRVEGEATVGAPVSGAGNGQTR